MKGLKKENNDIQKNGSFFKQKIANQKKKKHDAQSGKTNCSPRINSQKCVPLKKIKGKRKNEVFN